LRTAESQTGEAETSDGNWFQVKGFAAESATHFCGKRTLKKLPLKTTP
jgi:hypothetical protein